MLSKMTLIGPVVTILQLALLIRAYNMDEVTRSPIEVQTTAPEVLKTMVLDFEGRRSLTLLPNIARVSLGDAIDLCEAIVNDETTMEAMNGKKGFHFIPVRPDRSGLPKFTYPCFGWLRKRCSGIPKPPFDYRCHYWVPYYFFAGGTCATFGITPYRKKRRAHSFDTPTVSGVEAITLCSTVGQLPQDKSFIFDTVALPTNEASQLRCINWKASPEGGWIKEELSKPACDVMNAKRPELEIVDEVDDIGVIEDMFGETVRCVASGRKVNCAFVRTNIREPVPY